MNVSDTEKIKEAESNILIAIGYLTRDDEFKERMRNEGGLQLLVRILHNSAIQLQQFQQQQGQRGIINQPTSQEEDVVQNAARAAWNCASNKINKAALRELGGLHALVALLAHPSPDVVAIVSGALWNCAVEDETRRVIVDLGSIPLLISLLSLPHNTISNSMNNNNNEQILESVTGILWNCSAISEVRVALRKLNGLNALLSLLDIAMGINQGMNSIQGIISEQQNQTIQNNILGCLRNCIVNDQNKIAMKELNGFNKLSPLLSESTQPDILEKVISIIWIGTIPLENRELPTDSPMIPPSVFLPPSLTTIVEKILGSLRNYSTLAPNKIRIVQHSGLELLTKLLSSSSDLTSTIIEYSAATVWNCARNEEVKDYARQIGTIDALLNLLKKNNSIIASQQSSSLKEKDGEITNTGLLPDSALEAILGAILSLTENKLYMRNNDGLSTIAQVLVITNPDSSRFVVENCLGALKNCSANQQNAIYLRELGILPHLAPLVTSQIENISREACLLLKNISLVEQNRPYLIKQNLLQPLLSLSLTSASQEIAKIANDVVRCLSTNAECRALIIQNTPSLIPKV
ncbi:MAG: putative vacuolar protein 8 [Streblomastix strix]|uniref:Putative vacuolar protein 8 n=1 Tax=Streblomastix strix TaxID=222440 RepID=A0A5J4W076_9EUKA|nr:MAG: putative vacuolar protein 8 [Streblomastix strix]